MLFRTNVYQEIKDLILGAVKQNGNSSLSCMALDQLAPRAAYCALAGYKVIVRVPAGSGAYRVDDLIKLELCTLSGTPLS